MSFLSFHAILARIGRAILNLFRATGGMCFLFREICVTLFTYPLRWRQLLRQLLFVGIHSQPVVIITGIFTGGVFTAQTLFQFRNLGMASATGPVVSVAMCRELGPVLVALMVAGRVGSALAAELSTMKLSEQIDALRALAVYPTQYLIVPRFLAVVISMPLLVGMATAMGILASYLVAVPLMQVDGTYYMDHMIRWTMVKDIVIGLTKATCFGFIIALVSIHKGLNAGFGAEGVGQATTEAAVNSSVIVLISNFFFSFILNAMFHDPA